VPDLDDECEPCERDDERSPDPATDRLVKDEPCPEGDEDRRDILDQERDTDVQPVDREEVGPLDEGQPDAERDQKRELVGANA